MRNGIQLVAVLALLAWLTGCGGGGGGGDGGTDAGNGGNGGGGGTHTHADGTTHADDHSGGETGGHDHDEDPLGSTTVGGMTIEVAQGHGLVKAGVESHLVLKLPYNDSGATIVRAWIGSEDRTLSMVGKGEYAASHDDYDIHAEAPDPLPADAKWWFELEKPDGTKVVGSLPILK